MSSTRNPLVDLLRGISILLVILLHFALAYGINKSPLTAFFGRDAVAAVFYNGNFGVTMFFAISGYLIAGNALHRHGHLGRIGLRDFYGRRAGRILPSLLLATAIIVLLGILDIPFFNNNDGGHQRPGSFFIIASASVLTFWHNVLMQSVGYFNYCLNIYWSLSVEEVFYLTFPVLCLILRRHRYIAVLCLLLMLIAPWYRAQHRDNELYYMYGYLACFDAIAMGCLTAIVRHHFRLTAGIYRPGRIVAVVLLVVTYLSGIEQHEVFGFSLIAVATSMLLLFSEPESLPRWISGRAAGPVRWLGEHSYELYLFHIIILAGMRNVVERKALGTAFWLPWLAELLAASALTAYVVARYFGQPLNNMLRSRLSSAETPEPPLPDDGIGLDAQPRTTKAVESR